MLAIEAENDASKLDEDIALSVVAEALKEQRRVKMRLVTEAQLKEKEKYGELVTANRREASALNSKLGEIQQQLEELRRENEDLRAAVRLSESMSVSLTRWLVRALGFLLIAGVVAVFFDDIWGMFGRSGETVLWMRAALSCVLGIVTVLSVDYTGLVGWIAGRIEPTIKEWLTRTLARRRERSVEKGRHLEAPRKRMGE